jgi:hypothetical protein
MGISPNVVVLTRDELDEIKHKAFQRGVERGRFEQSTDKGLARVARNCKNWKDGYCDICGAQSQMMQITADYACPEWSPRTPPSPQSGGAVELYRRIISGKCVMGYERATKAEAVIEAAIEWRKHQEAFSDFDGDRRGIAEHLHKAKCRLLKALSALDKE